MITDFKRSLAYFNRFPTDYDQIIGIDCEATGIHLRHDSRPFMLCAVSDSGEGWTWKGKIDPLTRRVAWSNSDGLEVADLLNQPRTLYVMTNKKFDTRAMSYIVPDFDPIEFLNRCHDTLPIHHTFNNKEGHGLKDSAIKYAGIPDKDEKILLQAVRDAKTLAISMGLDWAFASKTTCPQQTKAPNGENSGGKGWAVMDYWLPEEVAKVCWERSEAGLYVATLTFDDHLTSEQEWVARTKFGWEWHPPEVLADGAHPWHTLCQEYCLYDCLRSVVLYKGFENSTKNEFTCDPISGERRSLWEVYLENSPAFTISYQVEDNGLSFFPNECQKTINDLAEELEDYARAVSKSLNPYTVFNPASPMQIKNVIYERFKIPVTRRTSVKKSKSKGGEAEWKQGNPTTDEDQLVILLKMMQPPFPEDYKPPRWIKSVESFKDYNKRLMDWHKEVTTGGEPLQLFSFLVTLLLWKKTSSTITKLKSYVNARIKNKLYPSLNPIGAKTPRYSSSNPNGQNIAKGKKSKIPKDIVRIYPNLKRNLRYYFGPDVGREWWSIDYSQLQLVIAATLCKSEQMLGKIAAGYDFHDAMARIIYNVPDNEQVEDWQRDITKNVNFGYWFGASAEKVELTCGVPGMYDKLANLFPEVPETIDRMSWEVRRNGSVTTLGGYRLFVPENAEYSGCVYAVQGTEGVLVKRATYCVQHFMETTESRWDTTGKLWVGPTQQSDRSALLQYVPTQSVVPAGTETVRQGDEERIWGAESRFNVLRLQAGQHLGSQSRGSGAVLAQPKGPYNSRCISDDMHFNLFLHDELDFDCQAGRGYAYIPAIVDIMEYAARSFGVPAKAVAKYHPDNWGESAKEEEV